MRYLLTPIFIFIVGLTLFAFASEASADIFQDGTGGYRGTTDSRIDSSTYKGNGDNMLLRVSGPAKGAFPNNSVQNDGSSGDRTYIKFDISSVPQDSTVTSATLELYTTGQSGDTTIDVFRADKDWVEGDSSASNGITRDYFNRGNGSLWTNELGDWKDANSISQGATSYASQTIIDTDSARYIAWDVTNLVQEWINGTYANYGFALTDTTSSGTHTADFSSRESGVVSQRPMLTVNYSGGGGFPPPPPPPPESPPLTATSSGDPVVLYQDILSGPNTGGENNNGIYLSIFGKNFGATQGSSKVYINNTEVASYKYWGPSQHGRSDIQQISVQIGPNITTGSIKVVVNGKSSNTDKTFTVRPGDIYFVDEDNGNQTTGVKNNISKPFKSVPETITGESDFGPGDTVVMRGGTWTIMDSSNGGYFLMIRKDGTLIDPIMVMGYPGESVNIIQTSGSSVRGGIDWYSGPGYGVISNVKVDMNGEKV